MQSEPILRSSESWRRSGGLVSRHYSGSWPIRKTNGCPRLRARVSPRSALRVLKKQILEFDRMINAWHRSSETSKRLDEIPGVGPAIATALVASVANPRAFRSGRDFSAWIGLVPRQHIYEYTT